MLLINRILTANTYTLSRNETITFKEETELNDISIKVISGNALLKLDYIGMSTFNKIAPEEYAFISKGQSHQITAIEDSTLLISNRL